MKKIAIIGGGVAGLTAAVYALRANAEVTMFEQFGLGGLVATVGRVENYPSYKVVEGWQLAMDMAEQANALGLKTVTEKVLSLRKEGDDFVIKTALAEYLFPSVVIATGTKHNKLGFEEKYVGKGVCYCATCDGNFYRNKPVAVAGGKNPAIKEALYLADICSDVYVLDPYENFRAEELSVERMLSHDNVHVAHNATVSDIKGEGRVQKVCYYDGQNKEIDVDALFVAVGSVPATDFLDIEVENKNGFLVVDGRSETSVKGLFAAGDVTDSALKQIITACGDGAKAGSFAAAHAAVMLAKAKK